MNKKVLFAGIIALTGVFASASAQQPQQNQAACCTEQSCAKPTSKACTYNPFAGLNLTEQQQAQIDALKQEQKAAREAAKKDKADRQQQDRQQAKDARAQNLAKIKAILTPEQYVTFLENSYLSAGQGHQQKTRPAQFRPERKFDKSQMKAKKMDKAEKSDKGDKSKK